jgi:hypothetical protein
MDQELARRGARTGLADVNVGWAELEREVAAKSGYRKIISKRRKFLEVPCSWGVYMFPNHFDSP